MRRSLKHGLLAGMAGGAAMAVVLIVVGEASIGRAIALEHARHTGDATEEMFSRGVQQFGGVTAVLLYGALVGAVMAVVFASVRQRVPWAGRWHTSMGVAGAGFLAVFLLPFLKYPANPPAVGDPETVASRTVLYLAAIGWSIVSVWAGWRLWRFLGQREWPSHHRMPAALGALVALATLGLVILPSNPDPVNAPATLIWNFRLSTAAGAVTMWSVMGMMFGWLQAETAERRQPLARAAEVPEVAEVADHSRA